MGGQELREKFSLCAWLAFWGHPHRLDSGEVGSLAGWMGSKLYLISLC